VNRFFICASRAKKPFPRRFAELAFDPRILGGWTERDTVADAPFFWLDLYGRLDPVPAGPLADGLLDASRLPRLLVKSWQVLNFDNPLDDHGAYFGNRQLVIPRIIRSLCGGEYPWPPRNAEGRRAEPTQADHDAGRESWAYGGARERVSLLARLQLVRCAAGALMLAHAALFLLDPAWRSAWERPFARLADLVGWLIQGLPWLEALWQGSHASPAGTLTTLSALLLPVVLLLAAQRMVRGIWFGEL
jgi:hypothetical protein